MNENNISLCCCEYFDFQHERNHILACCCNCQAVDESFDSLIRGGGLSSYQKRQVMTTFQDRLRIPWYGGARQISLDVLLAVLFLVAILLIATLSLKWLIVAFTFMFFLLIFAYYYTTKYSPRSKFFLAWTLSSVTILFVTFEFIVVPLLEILIHENVCVVILVVASCGSFWMCKNKTSNLMHSVEGAAELGQAEKASTRTNYCPICQVSVPEHDHHYLWMDCCVGLHNRFFYLLGLGLSISALLYSSNLTLTSVCHNYHIFLTVLMPDDCSEVYEQFEISAGFVSGVYGCILAGLMGVMFMYHFMLVCVGLTGQEWKALPFTKKVCFGLTTSRPYSKGCFYNWLRTLCYWIRVRRVVYEC